MRLLSAILIFLFFGCGYQPVSTTTHNLIGDNVFVDVIISKTDPQNTVVIKDALRKAVITRLNRTLTDKELADTIIMAKIKSLNFQVISYDDFGYATAYKAILVMDYEIKSKDFIKNIQTSGDYDFTVSKQIQNTKFTDSVISDNDRFNAIKNASEETFDELISKIAILGVKSGKYSK